MKDRINHIKICQKLYEDIGPSAVYDYANERGLNDWRDCSGCETSVPVHKDTCLVCGRNMEFAPKSDLNNNANDHLDIINDIAVKDQTVVFSAIKRSDPQYPGFDIVFNGEKVATVEYCQTDKVVRTLAYLPGEEDYHTKTVFKKVE